ncbi:conserved hypothetical protein [Thermomicrobium roseum DSM 5159]|uniref:Uncharacterized protein n=1 Tax=Thermomicrobium roseum (strain ATCC 27502 / DSM 5159 / P-2) TaxID=309801 RepID=B9L096_THERP|nr:conserved hypothetical protein [Thermomicrobium roseum DSM 5159]
MQPAGRGAGGPERVDRHIAGAARVRHRSAHPPPPCRGQALPDPPARQGRPTIPSPFVRCAIAVTACR